MCLARKIVEYLDTSNESDFKSGRVSYETFIRFRDLAARCRVCERFDNGLHDDVLPECRVQFARVVVSLRRDDRRAHPSVAPPPRR